MHDIRAIRDNPKSFDAAMARRGAEACSDMILQLDASRRAKIMAAETAQAEQNKASKEVGAAKAKGDEAEFERLRALVGEKKAEISELKHAASIDDAALQDVLMGLPNLPMSDVPVGADEADNIEIHRWGTPREFDFIPKEHFDVAMFDSDASGMSGIIGAKLSYSASGMSGTIGAKLSGSRFTVLYGAIARVHRALAQFMLDVQTTENGFKEVWTPVIVNNEALFGTGQLPKFTEDLYQLKDGSWLIPTAEVTLTNIVANETVGEAALPLRYTAHTQCFRSEAGSAGKDVRGMLRQHQFEKVEMVSITHPDHSRDELDRMTGCAQGILEKLGLPYRTVILCTGDMGFSARRTHDIEVWLPGQDMYREISSVSVCGDFQARRMNARFRPEGGGKPQFVHTLNGSGLAVGRCLIAVLENGQQADGAVALPDVLHGLLGGKTTLSAEGVLV